MKANKIVNAVARSCGKLGLKFRKHSPEILVITGVVGAVASGIMACRASTKVNDILGDAKDTIDKVHQALEDEDISEATYSKEDSKKDLTIVYVQTSLKLVKLYGPSILLGGVSIASILTGHRILRKRNVALAAAYTAVTKDFGGYRSRVVERFGEMVDKELRYNVKAKEITETVVDETGKETKIKKTVAVADDNGPTLYSDYARIYDDGCTGWTKDPELNLMFVRHTQNYANEVLKSKGYLFLNDVYEMLGFRRTKAGQVVGWVYDEDCPTGDNFVDFGIYEVYNEKTRDFVNGYERNVVLDFNVDGNILDLI